MNKIYSDGSYDRLTRTGAFCIVTVEHDKKPEWRVVEHDTARSSNDVEVAGLYEAIKVAHDISLSNMRQSTVFCDSLNAIQALYPVAKTAGVKLEHIRAHTVFGRGADITDDVKRQHWADVMARSSIIERTKC